MHTIVGMKGFGIHVGVQEGASRDHQSFDFFLRDYIKNEDYRAVPTAAEDIQKSILTRELLANR